MRGGGGYKQGMRVRQDGQTEGHGAWTGHERASESTQSRQAVNVMTRVGGHNRSVLIGVFVCRFVFCFLSRRWSSTINAQCGRRSLPSKAVLHGKVCCSLWLYGVYN